MRTSTWITTATLVALGLIMAVAVLLIAGRVLGGKSPSSTAQVTVPLRTSSNTPAAAASGEASAQAATGEQHAAPKDVISACKGRHPSDPPQQSQCAKEELDGLAYLDVFPAGWNFETKTSDDTFAAIKAGNPGAIMFQKCLKLHGARKSTDGFPHYAKMKTCLVNAQIAYNKQ